MDKKYEIALSYANSNAELSEIISYELDCTFDKAFFKDKLRMDELSLADPFDTTLKSIFRNSRFSLILYTKEYKNGQFAPGELEEIMKKAEDEKENNFFIIKADDSPVEKTPLQGAYYISLNPSLFKTKEEVQKKVEEIVQKNIKPCMIKKTIQDKKEDHTYKLNIHTVYDNGNTAKWIKNYDWNILSKKYIKRREVKEPYTWEDLWHSISMDFNLIKEELEREKETTRVIHFNCHLSLAYKLGQIYGNLNQPSTNRNLQLLSSNGKIKFVFAKDRIYRDEKDFCKEYSGNDMMGSDIICIVSIKKPQNEQILDEVKSFLDNENQKYHSIYLFQDERYINSTEELESLADYIYNKMLSSRIHGRNCRFHLFLDTITPLAFVLGGRRPFSGEVQLYEYLENKATYKKSLTRGIN